MSHSRTCEAGEAVGEVARPAASRIPYPSLDDLTPLKHARVTDPTRHMLNVAHMALHASEGLWFAQAALGRATIDAAFDPRLRELAILRVGWLQGSEYELFHHRAIATNVGVSAGWQAAVTGGDLAILPPAERALIDFVTAVVRDVSPDDATLAEMRQYHDDRFVFDMAILIGSYMLTARIAAIGGVQVEDRPVAGW